MPQTPEGLSTVAAFFGIGLEGQVSFSPGSVSTAPRSAWSRLAVPSV